MDFKAELLSWEKTRELSEIIGKKIKAKGYKVDVIVAIARGGLVPAMNISDVLGVSDILSIGVSHWGITAKKDERARIKFPLQADLSAKNVLIVDDLTDTGDSIKMVLEHIAACNPKNVKTATLLHKSVSTFEPDFYAEKVEGWKWIIFPWNLVEDLRNLIQRVAEKEGFEANALKDIKKLQKSLKKNFNLDIDEKIIKRVLEFI